MVNQALIPVAGWGTRLLPISRAIPKELLPIGPKPTLQWIGEELAQLGVTRICLVTSPDKPEIDQLFRPHAGLASLLQESGKSAWLESLWAHGPYAGTRISLALQPEQRGLGDAVRCGREQLEAAPFLLALGDCLMSPLGEATITRRMQELFAREQPDGVIALQRVPRSRVSRYGIAALAPGLQLADASELPLQDLIEKPDPAEAPSEWAVAGRYILSHHVFHYLDNLAPGRHNEIQLTDALRHMIRDGARFWGVTLGPGEQRIDVGNYQIYSQACLEYSLRNDPELRAYAQKLLQEWS